MPSRLKDANGKWVEELPISIELWMRIMNETRQGVLALLDSAQKLLENKGDIRIVAGLYTFGLEEYGKLLLLKRYVPSGNSVIIKYRDEFRNHNAKFRIAIESLPEECSILHEGTFSSESYEPDSFDTDQIADLKARLAIFYSDFTEDAESILGLPSVDKDRLTVAITQLYDSALSCGICT